MATPLDRVRENLAIHPVTYDNLCSPQKIGTIIELVQKKRTALDYQIALLQTYKQKLNSSINISDREFQHLVRKWIHECRPFTDMTDLKHEAKFVSIAYGGEAAKEADACIDRLDSLCTVASYRGALHCPIPLHPASRAHPASKRRVESESCQENADATRRMGTVTPPPNLSSKLEFESPTSTTSSTFAVRKRRRCLADANPIRWDDDGGGV